MIPQLRLVPPGGPESKTDVATLLERFEVGKADLTRETYRCDLDAFAAFMESPSIEAAISKLLALGPGEAYGKLLDYQKLLTEKPLQNVTINRKIAPVRSLLRLARQTGLIEWDAAPPALKVQPLRDTRGPRPERYREIVAAAQLRTDPKGLRDLAMIRLMHDLALRRHSVLWLDIEDVDLAGSEIWVREKGKPGKNRKHVPQPTLAALEAWIVARGQEPGPLFPNLDSLCQRPGRISPRSINRLVDRAGKAVGIRLTPHMLRHSGCSTGVALAMAAGYGLSDCLQYTGHKSVKTLQVYLDQHADNQGAIAALVAAS